MNKKKILLINPIIRITEAPYDIPLGLACIAAVIREAGHNVAIFDNNAFRLNEEEVIEQIKSEDWDLIGLGGLVTTYSQQKKMFTRLKKEFPSAILISGGGLATSIQEELMDWVPEIDLLVIGEGEKTILEILDNFEEKSWENVAGICFRENEEIKKGKQQRLLTEEELSNLPFPAFDLLPLEEVYFKHSSAGYVPEMVFAKRRISIALSRGCPFSCSFCIDLPTGEPRSKLFIDRQKSFFEPNHQKIRYFSPEWAVGLIKHLRVQYCVDFLNLIDENFTANKEKAMAILDLMEKQGLKNLTPPLRFTAAAQVNTLDKEFLGRLKEMGCSGLNIGIESMNQEILSCDIMKAATPEKNKQTFDACLVEGVYPIATFIIGLPHESAQSVFETTKFMKENGIFCGPFFVGPYPRTALFIKYKKEILEKFGSLENFVIKCQEEITTNFIINLTKYNSAELLGLRQMMINHDLEGIKAFAKEKNEPLNDE